MYEPVEKGPCRQNERRTWETLTTFERQAFYPTRIREDSSGPTEYPFDIGLLTKREPHPLSISPLVSLCPGRPDGRPAASIKQLELNPGRIDSLAHETAQRIDLADKVSLCGSADRRIARHVTHRVSRQGTHTDMTSHAGCRIGRFDSRVSGADNNHIERHCHYDYYLPMQKCLKM
jgi:hypothetical protein